MRTVSGLALNFFLGWPSGPQKHGFQVAKWIIDFFSCRTCMCSAVLQKSFTLLFSEHVGGLGWSRLAKMRLCAHNKGLNLA